MGPNEKSVPLHCFYHSCLNCTPRFEFLEIFTSRNSILGSLISRNFILLNVCLLKQKETFVSVVRSYAQTHKMILTKKTESITEGPRILTVGVQSSSSG